MWIWLICLRELFMLIKWFNIKTLMSNWPSPRLLSIRGHLIMHCLNCNTDSVRLSWRSLCACTPKNHLCLTEVLNYTWELALIWVWHLNIPHLIFMLMICSQIDFPLGHACDHRMMYDWIVSPAIKLLGMTIVSSGLVVCSLGVLFVNGFVEHAF